MNADPQHWLEVGTGTVLPDIFTCNNCFDGKILNRQDSSRSLCRPGANTQSWARDNFRTPRQRKRDIVVELQ